MPDVVGLGPEGSLTVILCLVRLINAFGLIPVILCNGLYGFFPDRIPFGVYPEGVSFSILIMNILTPLIDRYVRPRPFGAKKEAECNEKSNGG